MSHAGRPYTVIYDGHCHVCRDAVDLVARWDRRGAFEVVAFQDAGVQERFPFIPPAAYSEAMQLVGPDGRHWEGAAAIEQMLKVLPAGSLLGWAFRVPVLGGLIGRFYRWFARNRYRFGCGDHCALRPPRS